MTTLTAAQVISLALAAGFNRAEANVMTVIAYYESGWNPKNVGDQTLAQFGSRGLWQIFTGAHTPAELHVGSGPWGSALVTKLEVPSTNAACARIVYKEQGYRAWSTYNNLHGTAGWARLLSKVSAIKLGAPLPTHSRPARKPARWTVEAPTNRNPRAPKSLAFAQTLAADPARAAGFAGECEKFVREALGLSAKFPTAAAEWSASTTAHRHTYYLPPAGVPVHYGPNHVALSAGNGRVWSTDIGGTGTVSLVGIHEIEHKWGLTLLGWLDTCEDVSVYTP